MRAIRRAAFLSAMLVTASLQAQSPLPRGASHIGDASKALHYPISHADLIVVSNVLPRARAGEKHDGAAFQVATASCVANSAAATPRMTCPRS